MAEQQKIHPIPDPEAPPPPTAPLAPRSTFQSEKGDPDNRNPPPYAAAHAYPKPQKRKRNCCCRILCWLLSLILVLIIIIGIFVGVFFLVFRPKLPKFSVDSIEITQFSLNNDTLDASFNVNITARNPNKKIGIYYENGSNLKVLYKGTELCRGSLPKFYQGHRNTTVLNVGLTGQTQDGTTLLQSLQDQEQTGSIPLNLRAKVPVRIKVGKLKLPKWKFLVKCTLDVDNISANNAIRIRDNRCKFRFRF